MFENVTSALGEYLEVVSMFAKAQEEAEKRAKITHQRFNVFTSLLKDSDEVRLHTRFLHCLLNPGGLHDCGALFLDLFFDTLVERQALDDKGAPAKLSFPHDINWEVNKEAILPCGRIDLLLELEQQKCGLAIENKIHASEGDKQIERYFCYLEKRYGSAARVIYLTLDGRRSTTQGEFPYYRISYAEHILIWLDKCLRETYDIPPVNQVLIQYREVVRQLTGKTTNRTEMASIVEFISKHPNIIRFNREIQNGIVEARGAFFDRLAARITTELQERGIETRLRSGLMENRFGRDRNGALILTPTADDILRHVPFEVWIARYDDVLFVGAQSKCENRPPLSSQDELAVRYVMARECEKSRHNLCDPGRGPTDETYWPFGRHDLIYEIDDDDVLAGLLEEFDDTVSKLCKEIREHLDLLERSCKEALSVGIPASTPLPLAVAPGNPVSI